MTAITLSFPSKTFLLGEYAALVNLPSILIATGPRFIISAIRKNKALSATGWPLSLSPHDPCQRYYQQALGVFSEYELAFKDPHHAAGGFGASSAQWLGLMLLKDLLSERSIQIPCDIQTCFKIRQQYQQWFAEPHSLRPSGYDILSQLYGHMMYCDPASHCIQTLSWPWPDYQLIIAKTHFKTVTHTHLSQLDMANHGGFDRLGDLVKQAYHALEAADIVAFAHSINAYRCRLQRAGLVEPVVQPLMQALMSKPELIAFKGCGAGSADVMLLLLPKNKLRQAQVWLNAYFMRYQLVDAFAVPGAQRHYHEEGLESSLI